MAVTTTENPTLPYSNFLPGGNLNSVSRIVIDGSNENVAGYKGFQILLSNAGKPKLETAGIVIPLIFEVDYTTNLVTLKSFNQSDGMQVVRRDTLIRWPSLKAESSSFQISVVVSTVELRVDVGGEYFGAVSPLPISLDKVRYLVIDNGKPSGLSISRISIYGTSGTDSAHQEKAGATQQALAKK